MPFPDARRFLGNHEDTDFVSSPVEGAEHAVVVNPDYNPADDEPETRFVLGTVSGGGGGGGGGEFAAGTDSIPDTETSVEVAHGLGVVPETVLLTAREVVTLGVTDRNATTFTAERSGSSGDLNFDWLAAGETVFAEFEVFTESGTWSWEGAGSPDEVDVLIVAGGGGGGFGGGGAGGLLWAQNVAVDGDRTVTVGSGGAGMIDSSSTEAQPGTNSEFGALTALGGGAGQRVAATVNGGSGGGGWRNQTAGTATQPGSTDGGDGNNGGDGHEDGSAGLRSGGGGGGAGAAGQAGASSDGGDGGAGMDFSGDFGTDHGDAGWFAGGGGGTGGSSSGAGAGGQGGGGDAVLGSATGQGGQANSGGGGGGARISGTGGAGGSGIVIVRPVPA